MDRNGLSLPSSLLITFCHYILEITTNMGNNNHKMGNAAARPIFVTESLINQFRCGFSSPDSHLLFVHVSSSCSLWQQPLGPILIGGPALVLQCAIRKQFYRVNIGPRVILFHVLNNVIVHLFVCRKSVKGMKAHHRDSDPDSSIRFENDNPQRSKTFSVGGGGLYKMLLEIEKLTLIAFRQLHN